MNGQFTIGDTATKTGIPTKTIRFYEEKGLLSKVKRGENGYRIYSEEDLQKLCLIKQARSLGLPLSEVKELTKRCMNPDCKNAEAYFSSHVAGYINAIDTKIKELEELKQKMKGGEITMCPNCSC